MEDIYTGEVGSNPKFLTIENSTSTSHVVYFQARDKQRGEELWISDGVVETRGNDNDVDSPGSGKGTRLVKDIRTGMVGSKPHHLLMYNGKLLFYANDGVHGDELWISDGYYNGTMLVRDINPGADGSDGSQLIVYNGFVYFTANDGTRGHELYKTDGTLAGTSLLKDLCTGTCSGAPNFYTKFTPPIVNGIEELYFTANMGVDGAELWITDGTAGNTRRAFQHTRPDIDIDEKSHHMDFPPALAVYHGSLYWSGNEGRADIELPRGGFSTDNDNDQGILGLENAIVIEDVDIASDLFHIKLSCKKGYLSLAKTIGLTFLDGDGTKDRQMEFTTNVTNVNEAFRWLQYQTVPNENGEDEILIVVNDTAHNGAYDTWEESKNVIHVWIEEKNDAPTVVRAPHNPEKYF